MAIGVMRLITSVKIISRAISLWAMLAFLRMTIKQKRVMIRKIIRLRVGLGRVIIKLARAVIFVINRAPGCGSDPRIIRLLVS